MRVTKKNVPEVAHFAAVILAFATAGQVRFIDQWPSWVKKKVLLRLDYVNGRFIHVRVGRKGGLVTIA